MSPDFSVPNCLMKWFSCLFEFQISHICHGLIKFHQTSSQTIASIVCSTCSTNYVHVFLLLAPWKLSGRMYFSLAPPSFRSAQFSLRIRLVTRPVFRTAETDFWPDQSVGLLLLAGQNLNHSTITIFMWLLNRLYVNLPARLSVSPDSRTHSIRHTVLIGLKLLQ